MHVKRQTDINQKKTGKKFLKFESDKSDYYHLFDFLKKYSLMCSYFLNLKRERKSFLVMGL